MAQKHTFIVSSLQISELLYFCGKIKSEKQLNKLAFSNYSRQICKTRFLILENDEIIAAPVFMRFSEIHIIASKKYVQSGDFANYISKSDIILKGPLPLKLNIYNECLNYSLICKLSPEWNKLDKYFVKSFNFLTNETFDGVSFEAWAKDEYFDISIKKETLLLPTMKTQDIEVDLIKLKNTDIIPIQKNVYLLPRFITGKLVSISKKLPNSCLFRTYSDIRLYWRNMYGYHLPRNSEGMLYARVLLNRSDIPYIYPFCCIRFHTITQIEPDGPSETINDFIFSFMKKCRTLCGKKIELKLQPKTVTTQSIFFKVSDVPPTAAEIEQKISTKEPETKKTKFDIDYLARTKDLHKATTAELLKFCKEHDIQVHAKNKKQIIISQIYRLYDMFSDEKISLIK